MSFNSLEEKKVYLIKMSQHFKEIADRQRGGNETERVIANTLSKNADIMDDIYSLIERLYCGIKRGKKSKWAVAPKDCTNGKVN